MREIIRDKKAAISILIVAVLFIGYGIFRGEINTVFQKAAAICLECIGIG